MAKLLRTTLSCCAVLLVLAGIGGGLYFFKSQKKAQQKPIHFAITEEKPFVVIIPSYNNARYCEQNLRTVLDQNYDNFRVIYIDDCSSDKTYEKVQEFVKRTGKANKVTLIRNPKNQRALANIYYAIHEKCKDEEIVVCVDGDDFLAHSEVLTKLNAAYADPSVWLTYGNYLDYPTYKQKPQLCKKLPLKTIQKVSFRLSPWCASHLKTFYAGLFKQIKKEDLLYENAFIPMAWDLAFMFPMLEMAGKHHRFIRDVLYLYNRSNPLNDHKVNLALQQDCERHIRSLPKYTKLQSLPWQNSTSDTAQ